MPFSSPFPHHWPTDQSESILPSCLHKEAKEGNEQNVNFLLQRGEDPNVLNSHGETAIHVAALHGRWKIIKLLLLSGANINARVESDGSGETPLIVAAGEGNLDVVELLLYFRADRTICDRNGNSALHTAAWHGHFNIVELLLDGWFDANILTLPDIAGNVFTPLYYAAWKGHEAIFRLLVKHGADINIRGLHGWTLLQSAVSRGSRAIVRRILIMGAKIDDQEDREGITALHLAAKSKYCMPSMLDLLVEHGARLEVVDLAGNNALHHAAHRGNGKVIARLLHHFDEQEVSTICLNYLGQTARDVAKIRGHYAYKFLEPHEKKQPKLIISRSQLILESRLKWRNGEMEKWRCETSYKAIGYKGSKRK